MARPHHQRRRRIFPLARVFPLAPTRWNRYKCQSFGTFIRGGGSWIRRGNGPCGARPGPASPASGDPKRTLKRRPSPSRRPPRFASASAASRSTAARSPPIAFEPAAPPRAGPTGAPYRRARFGFGAPAGWVERSDGCGPDRTLRSPGDRPRRKNQSLQLLDLHQSAVTHQRAADIMAVVRAERQRSACGTGRSAPPNPPGPLSTPSPDVATPNRAARPFSPARFRSRGSRTKFHYECRVERPNPPSRETFCQGGAQVVGMTCLCLCSGINEE